MKRRGLQPLWRWIPALCLALTLLFAGGVLRAEALPMPRATAPVLRFAVVIGNNRSLGGRRPDLHYADDDAARYFEILQTIAPGRVFLLSAFDRDTARLFPKTMPHATAPTASALQGVGMELKRQIEAAKAAGQETELYFIFAGHGDVAAGRGFVELADARFDSDQLEAWLRRIPFTRAHVILDSCNSFFMLGVRKPGGRHFATSEDAARTLSQRLPNVGVFLSTSAEGEAFEWSEIQSGIFSHVVRSGLLGAADANADGSVSYLELSAFVDTATGEVPNPNMRPHVFARGPGAADHTPIVHLRDLTHVRRLEFTDNSPLRIRLRDVNGLPLVDAHAERVLALALPASWAEQAAVERTLTEGTAAPPLVERFTLPEGAEPVTLALLERPGAHTRSRGPAEPFQQLFVHPYGPAALAHYITERAARPAPVYGVSAEHTRRMQDFLDRMAAAEGSKRLMDGVGSVGFGALLVAGGADVLIRGDRHQPGIWILGGGLSLVGTAALVEGIGALSSRSIGEETASRFRSDLESGKDPLIAFAAADERLQEIVAAYEEERLALIIAGGVFTSAGAAGLVLNEVFTDDTGDRASRRLYSLGGIMIGSLMLTEALTGESPGETLANIWRDDPTLKQYRPSVSVGPNQATLGVMGLW